IVHHRVLVHDSGVDVGIVDDGAVYVNHRGVIGKLTSAPLAAYKADTHVAVSVVDAAVVAHVHAPVSWVEQVNATRPAPVWGSPEGAFVRRGHPGTGHPVI